MSFGEIDSVSFASKPRPAEIEAGCPASSASVTSRPLFRQADRSKRLPGSVESAQMHGFSFITI